jgi:hypothetical protein
MKLNYVKSIYTCDDNTKVIKLNAIKIFGKCSNVKKGYPGEEKQRKKLSKNTVCKKSDNKKNLNLKSESGSILANVHKNGKKKKMKEIKRESIVSWLRY